MWLSTETENRVACDQCKRHARAWRTVRMVGSSDIRLLCAPCASRSAAIAEVIAHLGVTERGDLSILVTPFDPGSASPFATNFQRVNATFLSLLPYPEADTSIAHADILAGSAAP